MKVSSKYNEQGGERLTDRYWGDVPMFLKYIPEANVCVPNTDFIELVHGLQDGSVLEKNVPQILLDELNIILAIIADPAQACLVDPKYSLIIEVINGNPSPCSGGAPCEVACDQMVCCNATFKCSCI